MKHASVDINEKTKISLWSVLVIIPTLAGGMLWLTNIDAKATAAQDELKQTRQLLQNQLDRLQSIDNRLSRIEGKLNQ